VQIVEVNEREERRRDVLTDPLLSRRFHRIAAQLHVARIRAGEAMQRELACISVESAGEPKTPVEHKSAHECAGLVSARVKLLGERRDCGSQSLGVVSYAV